MNPEAAQANERILAQVESWGGSYAWDAEIFAVTLLDVAVTDAQAAILRGLTEVEQIALNASRLTFPTIQAIAGIPGLESLVISNIELTSEQRDLLRSAGPEVEMIEHEP